MANEEKDRERVWCGRELAPDNSGKLCFLCADKLDSAQESLLIVKTKASVLNEIVRLVKETHSYDIPEIIALPIVGGNRRYLEWIDREVK